MRVCVCVCVHTPGVTVGVCVHMHMPGVTVCVCVCVRCMQIGFQSKCSNISAEGSHFSAFHLLGERPLSRDEAIMLLIFPIMLFHNALEYVLLCQ